MTSATKAKTVVRWMIRRDIDAVAAIESEQSGEWGREDFLTELSNTNSIGFVAEDRETEQVVGFAVIRLAGWRDERNTGEVQLRKLAVDLGHEGCGVGSALLVRAIKKVRDYKRNRLVAEPTPLGWDWLRHCGGNAGAVDSSPVTFGPLPEVKPEWVTSDVRFLCGGESAPYLWMLADALQDAGCEDEWLLTLFRKDGAMGRAVYEHLRPQLTTP